MEVLINWVLGFSAVAAVVVIVSKYLLVIKEVGDFCNSILIANQDGTLTNEEIVDIVKEFKEILPAFKKAID